MKKTILFPALCLCLLLTGCGSSQPEPAETPATTAAAETTAALPQETAPVETVPAETEAAVLVTETEETLPELSSSAFQVVYNVITDGGEETAFFQGIGPGGALVWTYETGSYSAAQLSRITPLGRFADTYYLVEDGTITALDIVTGQVLFQNTEFRGSPASEAFLFDDYGYLCISGFDSPDLFVMDPEGHTILRESSISEEYCRPFRMEIQDGQLVVYMESDSHGNSGNFPCYVDMTWIPQALG